MNTICLIGPTGVGKTRLALDLAKTLDGEIVNLDKIYIYKDFSLGTGLSDNDTEPGIRKHLYRLIEPTEEIIPPDEYARLVRKACNEINRRGKTAIIEGGSTTYFPAVYKENERDKFIDQKIGLQFPRNFDVAKKIENRIDSIIKGGLLDEVAMGLEKYPNSLIMKDCHFIVPLVAYLKGETDLHEAKKKMLSRNLEYIEKQLKCFRSFPKVIWMEAK